MKKASTPGPVLPRTPAAAQRTQTLTVEVEPPIEDLNPEVLQALAQVRFVLRLCNGMALLVIAVGVLVAGVMSPHEQLEASLGIALWVSIIGVSVGLNVAAYRGMVLGSGLAWLLAMFLGVVYTLLFCVPLGAILVALISRRALREHCIHH